MLPPYALQYVTSVIVTAASAMLVAVQLGGPNLGLDAHVVAWLGIVSAGLGVLNGILPRVQVPPGSPPSPH